MVEPGIEPGTSWLVVRSSDHQATRLVAIQYVISSLFYLFWFLDRAFSQLKKRTNQQNAQINFGLINLLLLITPTCFGHLIEAIIREFKILESYKPLW